MVASCLVLPPAWWSPVHPRSTQTVSYQNNSLETAASTADTVVDFYTWTRDSALTLKMIVDEFLFGKTELRPYIEDYITAQAVLQTVKNPSGSLLPSGLGLGEPKFNVDGTKFNGNWGRPQRDGPALRSIAIVTYSNYLVAQGDSKRVREVIWPIISNDLSYTGQYWYVHHKPRTQRGFTTDAIAGTQPASISGRRSRGPASSPPKTSTGLWWRAPSSHPP